MPPKKTETPAETSVVTDEPGAVAAIPPAPEPDLAHPLPSGGGCYVIEAGELKQSQEPTRDPRSAADPV